MLGQQQRQTLFLFLDVITSVLGESQESQELSELSEKVNEAYALMERDFPMSLQVAINIVNGIVGLM